MSTTYKHLDDLLLKRIASADVHGVEFYFLHITPLIFAEACRLSDATGREIYRMIEGRLQALRKRGLIRFDSKLGWLAAYKATT